MERTPPSGQPKLSLYRETANDDARSGSRVLRSLLRFPLFYKILIANAAVVLLVATGCALLAHVHLQTEGFSYLLLLAAGLGVSLLSNAVILRLALSPLRHLERTAQRVQAGDLGARAAPSDLADRELERLTGTFNAMLDSGDLYRKRLRDIAARALTATEEERKRIARELHDGIAQTLAALRVRLRIARSVEDEEVRTGMLDRISADIGEATEEIRRIAQGLRPPALDMLGLAPAIESCTRSVGEATGLIVTTDIAGVEGLLSGDTELAVYRIIQEALSNVARHSGAQRAWVRLATTRTAVVVAIEDDGRGFDVALEMSSGGLGLFGMQERGAYVGGTVDIASEPGSGTRIRVTIPTAETARYA